MSLSPAYVFSVNMLQPYLNDANAREINVPLAPGVYARGTILGQISATSVGDVQTLTVTGAPTASTLTVFGLPGNVSATFPQNATPAQAQAAIVAATAPGAVVVTGTGGAAGTYILTWAGQYANRPVGVVTATGVYTGGTAPSVTVAHTTQGVGPTGVFSAYAAGNSDGTQLMRGILQYPATVDAGGNIFVSQEVPTFSELVSPMFYKGTFRTEELVGLDNAAVTSSGGHLVTGNVTVGVMSF